LFAFTPRSRTGLYAAARYTGLKRNFLFIFQTAMIITQNLKNPFFLLAYLNLEIENES
jgi:hypothetical protein